MYKLCKKVDLISQRPWLNITPIGKKVPYLCIYTNLPSRFPFMLGQLPVVTGRSWIAVLCNTWYDCLSDFHSPVSETGCQIYGPLTTYYLLFWNILSYVPVVWGRLPKITSFYVFVILSRVRSAKVMLQDLHTKKPLSYLSCWASEAWLMFDTFTYVLVSFKRTIWFLSLHGCLLVFFAVCTWRFPWR